VVEEMEVEEEVMCRMGASAVTNLPQALEETLLPAMARLENEVEEPPMQLELHLYHPKAVNDLQVLVKVMHAETARMVRQTSVRRERQQTRDPENPNQPISECPLLPRLILFKEHGRTIGRTVMMPLRRITRVRITLRSLNGSRIPERPKAIPSLDQTIGIVEVSRTFATRITLEMVIFLPVREGKVVRNAAAVETTVVEGIVAWQMDNTIPRSTRMDIHKVPQHTLSPNLPLLSTLPNHRLNMALVLSSPEHPEGGHDLSLFLIQECIHGSRQTLLVVLSKSRHCRHKCPCLTTRQCRL
jgi:hypothetical protein